MTTYRGFSTFNRFKKYRLTDYELAKQDLYNHFQIKKGEKLMNPNFGSEIWSLLFEPFTDDVKQKIINDINDIVRYDPRLSVDSVLVTQFDYGIQVELTLTYIPTNQVETLYMQFDQKS